MRLFVLTAIVIILGGCVNYNQLSFTPAELFPNKRFENNVQRYNIIVHDEERVAVLKNPEIVDNSIKGSLTYIPKDSVVEKPMTKESIRLHRSDVHIYLDGKQDYELPEFKNGRKDVAVKIENIKEITAFSSNEKDIIGTIFLVLGVVVLAIVALILFMVLMVSLFFLALSGGNTGNNNNTSGGSNSGGSNSGGSNSGGSNSGGSGTSNSNSGGSGGSNSGGSNSGGSGGSGSGCYIATMAYGDYNDPQVLALRRFRDQTLLKTKHGRAFVKLYYFVSPKVVSFTKNWHWLHKFIRAYLDNLVKWLEAGKNIS